MDFGGEDGWFGLGLERVRSCRFAWFGSVGGVIFEWILLIPWDTYVRIHTYGTYGDQTTDSVPSPDR